MNFTDLFIRRPVLATTVSLMILVLGFRALATLPVLQFPQTENAVVTITTTYYGANPDVVAGFITTPLENAVAQANGIDYMTSSSAVSISTITVNLRLNYDPDKAMTEITSKVSSVLNQLPNGTQQPVLSIKIGQTFDAMYIGFKSDVLKQNQITDYLVREVQPKLQAVQGVQTAEIIGQQNFALRAWLDPDKMAAYGVTAADVAAALQANNYISGVGATKGQMVQVNLTASTDLHSLDEFRNLIVKQVNNANIRLSDVASVALGADSYDTRVAFDGQDAVYIGIQAAPAANLLDVVKGVYADLPDIQSQLPQGLESAVIYDSTDFVNSAIHEVVRSLVEAVVIVILVVFVFLGSLRSVLIPSIAIPVSLIGTFMMMLAFGFTINLLTLLALVLAIGLVVDDAIIVVENVNRHLDEGMEPLAAAIQAARELAGPIIAMTVVLVAVYVPIGFQGGLTGALFTEFAFTLVGAVTVSAIVALTLSPMMSSRLLKPHHEGDPGWQAHFMDFIDHHFNRVRDRYRRMLHGSLDTLAVTGVFAAIILVSIYFLWGFQKNELAPDEDQGFVIGFATTAPNATLQQKLLYTKQLYGIFSQYPELQHVFQIDAPGNAPGSSLAGLALKPWDQRKRTANQIQPLLQQQVNGQVAGEQVATALPPSLPGAFGLPIQFVITTTQPFEQLNTVAQEFLKEAQSSGNFFFVNTDLRIDQPQSVVTIDREKASQLGLRMSDVGAAMAEALGGGYVNYFNLSGRSYKVMPQVTQAARLNPDQLLGYYINTGSTGTGGGASTGSGTPIPLSTIASIKTETVPESLNHFQQLNSATIQGVAALPTGDALAYLRGVAKKVLPQGYTIDYGGPLRQYVQESSGFLATFGFAVIIIFLALSALFESFRDPLVILVSVPMSIAGALVVLLICSIFQLPGASLNIYSEVGLVTLMGLISKHGILIVEFANSLQEQGKSKREAIEEAATIRFRPILMTTAAMVFGVLPLITASGAGAISRFSIGLIIFSGLAIGTLFTLFVVPAVYMLIGATHAHAAEGDVLPAPQPH
ncbi:MAG TPA: efflux RND transporter permease subunit [Stellaceae bacterium]|jgi:multidrug efflux pump|nr:efflux RND transporter permease subunit [Stellaceae bacterium]